MGADAVDVDDLLAPTARQTRRPAPAAGPIRSIRRLHVRRNSRNELGEPRRRPGRPAGRRGRGTGATATTDGSGGPGLLASGREGLAGLRDRGEERPADGRGLELRDLREPALLQGAGQPAVQLGAVEVASGLAEDLAEVEGEGPVEVALDERVGRRLVVRAGGQQDVVHRRLRLARPPAPGRAPLADSSDLGDHLRRRVDEPGDDPLRLGRLQDGPDRGVGVDRPIRVLTDRPLLEGA